MVVISVASLSILYFRGFIQEFSALSHTTEWIIVGLIPFLFAVFLSGNHSWESEAYVGSLKFYEAPLQASSKTLISVSAFAYLIKEPVSRVTVVSIIITSSLAILGVRFFMGKGKLAQALNSKTAKFLVVASKDEFEELKTIRSITVGWLLGLIGFDVLMVCSVVSNWC